MIYVGPLQVDETLQAQVRALLASSDDAQAAIAHLRHHGESKIGSIRALVAAGGFTLGEAKRLVHSSETWQDSRHTDEALHESLQTALRTIEATEAPALLPRAG